MWAKNLTSKVITKFFNVFSVWTRFWPWMSHY
jgi:hypothetical protein